MGNNDEFDFRHVCSTYQGVQKTHKSGVRNDRKGAYLQSSLRGAEKEKKVTVMKK